MTLTRTDTVIPITININCVYIALRWLGNWNSRLCEGVFYISNTYTVH